MKSHSDRFNFIKRAFGSGTIARDGKNIAVKCPICNHHKRKLSINVENWTYHCWDCDAKGKNLSYLLKDRFSPEIRELYMSEFSESGGAYAGESLEKECCVLSLPKGFILLAENMSSRDPDIRDCLRYVSRRGLGPKDLWRFGFGTTKLGRFRRRVIFPSFDSFGDLNYFVGRAVDDSARLKYLNATIKKRDIVFNELYIDWFKEVVVTEGPFDLAKCPRNSTCLLGSTLDEKSLLFKRLASHATPVLLALDKDMSQKSYKIAKKLSAFCCEVRILPKNKFSDVGEMSSEYFKQISTNSVKFNRMEALRDKIRSIESGSLI